MKPTDTMKILVSKFNRDIGCLEKKMYLTLQRWNIPLAEKHIGEYVIPFLEINDNVVEKNMIRWFHASIEL